MSAGTESLGISHRQPITAARVGARRHDKQLLQWVVCHGVAHAEWPGLHAGRAVSGDTIAEIAPYRGNDAQASIAKLCCFLGIGVFLDSRHASGYRKHRAGEYEINKPSRVLLVTAGRGAVHGEFAIGPVQEIRDAHPNRAAVLQPLRRNAGLDQTAQRSEVIQTLSPEDEEADDAQPSSLHNVARAFDSLPQADELLRLPRQRSLGLRRIIRRGSLGEEGAAQRSHRNAGKVLEIAATEHDQVINSPGLKCPFHSSAAQYEGAPVSRMAGVLGTGPRNAKKQDCNPANGRSNFGNHGAPSRCCVAAKRA